jgi:putative lipoprotein
MHVARPLLLATLLPLFAGCHLLGMTEADTPPALSGQTRMQGSLAAAGGHLLFTPCSSPRTFVVTDNGKTGLVEEAASFGQQPGPLFADLRGRFDGNAVEGKAGQLNLQTLYRVEPGTTACTDPNFKVTLYSAQGAGWAAKVNGKGMKLEREGQPALAVPYVQEQLPGGGTSLSTDANNQHIELWLAPQRCAEGDRVSFLTAELRVGDTVQRGCAYPGGAQAD